MKYHVKFIKFIVIRFDEFTYHLLNGYIEAWNVAGRYQL